MLKLSGDSTPSRPRHRGQCSVRAARVALKLLPHRSHRNIALLLSQTTVSPRWRLDRIPGIRIVQGRLDVLAAQSVKRTPQPPPQPVQEPNWKARCRRGSHRSPAPPPLCRSSLSSQVGGQLGGNLASEVPADAGQLTILESDQLSAAQDLTSRVTKLPIVTLLALLLYGLAVYLALVLWARVALSRN